jgi:lambda family phage minor tail protein L
LQKVSYNIIAELEEAVLALTDYQLNPDPKVELFEIDCSGLTGNTTDRIFFCSHAIGDCIFQGQAYKPWEFLAEGYGIQGRGQLPTPTIRLSNIGGIASQFLQQFNGAKYAKVIRRLTPTSQLNVPTLDYQMVRPPDIFYIAGYSETRIEVVLKLKSHFDLEQVKCGRVILKNQCPWYYKDTNCGYSGNLLTCNYTLNDCESHFGTGQPLPFGGFPGVDDF